MDEERLVALRTYYESLSDEALRAEAGRGRDAFVPEAWTVVSQQVDMRRIAKARASRRPRKQPKAAAVVAPHSNQLTPGTRLVARIDALPPTIRPAAYGALLIVLFAMARGAQFVLPVVVIYVLATSAQPWESLLTGVAVAILAMLGGALSGLAYGLVGRHVQAAVRGGYYLTGVLTLAPYMFVLQFIVRLTDGEPFWQRLSGGEIAMSSGMALLFGLVLGHAFRSGR